MAFWSWSRTSNSNASADSTINWAEGQPPSSVNDSARAMMARTAEYRDDIAGATVTGGTSTAYTFTSFQVFDSLAHMNNAMICFVPHTTNTGACTLNVDGLGAWALRSASGADIPSGTLLASTPYAATFYSSSNQWILHGFYGNPYNIPIAGGMDYWGSSAPNSSFAFPAGQAISRTTYSALFAIMSTTYGTGDGSTTFNLPDKTGRVSAMKEASGVRLTSSYYGDSTTLGSSGGTDHTTIVMGNLPASPAPVTATTSGYNPSGTLNAVLTGSSSTQVTGPGALNVYLANTFTPVTGFASLSVGSNTANLGSAIPIANVPPLIICNYIIRII